MKKIVFSIVFLAGVSFASLAQEHNHQGGGQHGGNGGQHQGGGQGVGQKLTAQQKSQKLTQYMTTALSLTADQQQKVGVLNESKAVQMDTIRSQNKGNMEAAKTQVKTLKDQYNASLKTILTADQLTKWEDLKKQKKEEFQKAKAAGTKPADTGLTPEDVE